MSGSYCNPLGLNGKNDNDDPEEYTSGVRITTNIARYLNAELESIQNCLINRVLVFAHDYV